MAEKRDYYEVLGVKKDATADEIKKAFRKLTKENHPDLHPGDKACEERFKEAEMYAAEDKKRKEEVDTRNEGDQMAYQIEKTLNEMGDKLDPSDKSEAEAKLQNLKSALTGTDSEAIKSATEELRQVFYKISEKLYQAQGGQPGAGFDPSQAQGGQPGGNNNGQDYYDADYTVVDDDK